MPPTSPHLDTQEWLPPFFLSCAEIGLLEAPFIISGFSRKEVCSSPEYTRIRTQYSDRMKKGTAALFATISRSSIASPTQESWTFYHQILIEWRRSLRNYAVASGTRKTRAKRVQ